MCDGTEPIEDGECLYRRIPANANYYDPARSAEPSPMAFRPRESDTTGLSISRAKYLAPDRLPNPRGKPYYVAVLKAGDLRAMGITVVSKPVPDNLGHAELSDLTWANRSSDSAEEKQQMLARKLCLEILGPF